MAYPKQEDKDRNPSPGSNDLADDVTSRGMFQYTAYGQVFSVITSVFHCQASPLLSPRSPLQRTVFLQYDIGHVK